jgi:hypothetical protein
MSPALTATDRLATRSGRDLRTCTGNNCTVLRFFLAADDLLSCSVRHRFKTLT